MQSKRAVTSFKPACRCLDVPASYRYHQLWYALLNADCKSHLGYAAQSNEDASEYDHIEGTDPPPNSRHHPKRQKVHFQPFPTIDGIACKCIQSRIKRRTSMYTIIYTLGNNISLKCEFDGHFSASSLRSPPMRPAPIEFDRLEHHRGSECTRSCCDCCTVHGRGATEGMVPIAREQGSL